MKREIFFFKNYAKNEAGRLVADLFLFFKYAQYDVKASGLPLSCNIFRQSSALDSMKTNCIKLQTIDPGIYSTLIFQKRNWDQFLHHIFCMIFQEKCFSCYVLLTDQISLFDCLYLSRYWPICVLQLLANQAVTSKKLRLTLSFESRCFVR